VSPLTRRVCYIGPAIRYIGPAIRSDDSHAPEQTLRLNPSASACRVLVTLKFGGGLSCLLRAGLCQTSRMASDKSALVLLHGITMSGESAWREVVSLLADHHRVFVPNALGHRGGPSVQLRPVTMSDVVDAAEQYLDEHGLDRPHLAGNSMGGYMAIELARR
jgi:pimeloyl-ACP methyl ester carboxylesterase